ncbi:hypothetical protein [Spirosoma pulveris]
MANEEFMPVPGNNYVYGTEAWGLVTTNNYGYNLTHGETVSPSDQFKLAPPRLVLRR